MIADINKYVNFLTENHLSENHFLILWLVYTKDVENIKKYKQTFGDFDVNAIQYLIDYGWLDDFGIASQNRDYMITDFLVSDRFIKRIVIDEEDSYEELCQVYPKWLLINGSKVPAITGDPVKIAKDYLKCHKKNRIAHERVINITKNWFKSKPYAQEKIENYILNRRWNLYEEELTKGSKENIFQTL
ncbi:MAG: hypothetical protein ACK53T_07890 [Planctomycetota bacterium]|jgi:hypothetical protein